MINKQKLFKTIKIVLGMLIVILSLYYCTRLIYNNWEIICDKKFNYNFYNISAAFAFNIMYLIMLSWCWQRLTLAFKCSLPAKLGMPIWLITYIGRYIPGKVLFVMGRVMAYNAFEAKVVSTTYATILDNLFHILTATVVGACTLIFVPQIPLYCKIALVVGALVGCSILLNPYLCNKILHKAISKFNTAETENKIHVTGRQLIRLLSNYLLAYIPLTLSVYFLAQGLGEIPFYKAVLLTGCLSSGTALGILAIVLPSGLGVREGIFAWLASFFIAGPNAAVLPIISRLLMTISELICMVVAIIVVIAQKNFLKLLKVNQKLIRQSKHTPDKK